MDAISQIFETLVATLNSWVWEASVGIGDTRIPWLAAFLIGVGVFLTVRMGFIQFRKLGHSMRVVRGDFDHADDEGDISHFQALTTALSATVGVGNIAGVAMAIHWGGPGAIFWMWLTALLGMCTKYTEVSLAMKYRDFDEDGNASGGPQKYISKGMGKGWKPLGIFFAACAILSSLGAGNMSQINTLAQAIKDTTGVDDTITGIVCVVLVGIVILGGIQRIGKVTSILAPAMALLYVGGALVALGLNFSAVPAAFGSIIDNAFNPTSGVAGTAAGAWSLTLLWGVKRGLFSNEAGQGSAPIAHAAARTDEPLSEGLVALLEPFIDTLVICTMTALVILSSGIWDKTLPEAHELAHKDIEVWTWPTSTDEAVTMRSFGRMRGRDKDVKAVIELAGYEGSPIDGKTGEDEEPAKATLIIKDGRAVSIRHADGTVTSAVLAKNNAPIDFDQEGYGIYTQTEPGKESERELFSGEVTVLGGSIDLDSTNLGSEDDPRHIQVDAATVRIGQSLTAEAFGTTLGATGRWIVTLTVILFALSTAISWSYYGDRCSEFLFGVKGVLVYRILFLGFVFLGAILPLQTVWTFGDVALGLMTIPNLLALIFLSGKVRRMQNEYFAKPEHK